MATQNPRMGSFSDKAEKEEGFYEQARERIGDCTRETESLVRRNPGSSALVTFGIGFGLGLLATHLMLSESRRRLPRHTWLKDYLPDMPAMPTRHQIADAIASVLPDQLARRM